jgi:hypothetical protein
LYSGPRAPVMVEEAGGRKRPAVLLRLSPPQRLGTLMVMTIIAAVGTAIAAIAAGVQEVHIATGLSHTTYKFSSRLFQPAFLVVIVSVCEVALIVSFMIWFHRAYRNEQRRGRQLRFSTGQAVWAWMIPFFNFVRPKQIVNDIWRASTSPESEQTPWSAHVDPRIHLWWALWIAGGIIASGAMQIEPHHITTLTLSMVHRGEWAAVAFAAWEAVQVISLGLLCWFVVKVTRAQDRVG